jgi:phasin family protein
MKDQTEQMEKITQGLIQSCDEMNATCCKSVDALMEATTAASKGCEEWSRNLGGLVQESMSRAMNAGKIMLAAKNLQDAAETQTEFVKSLFDSWMAGAGRLSQISARMTQEAFEPVVKHANDTMGEMARRTQQGKAA